MSLRRLRRAGGGRRRPRSCPLPDHWNFAEGAALPVTYATAYAGLVRYGGLRAGERVLIHSAAGSVGIAATQIAKIVGAEVFGTASPPKHDAIRRFGVDHPLTTARTTWSTRSAGSPGRSAARPRHGRGRRAQLQAELLAPSGRRAARVLRRVRGAGRRAPQPAPRAAGAGADAALRPAQADERVEVGDRPQHAQAVGRQGVARGVHRPASGVDRRRPPAAGGGRAFPLEEGAEATATSTPARTSARWSSSCEAWLRCSPDRRSGCAPRLRRCSPRYAFPRCLAAPPAPSPSSPPSGGITRGGRQPQAQGERR